MRVITRAEIEAAIADVDLLPAIEDAFVAYSAGRTNVPPVGELLLDDPPGEVHIKYGHVVGDDHYVIKVASGFPENRRHGLPTGDGLMLVFSAHTGAPEAVLQDGGLLTDVRTAAAGAIAAAHLAPRRIDHIGIVGTGLQARLQLRHLADATDCRTVSVWGRNPTSVTEYIDAVAVDGFAATAVEHPDDLLDACQLIVTTTAATEPLVTDASRLSGVHITAMGSDTPDKQELAVDVVGTADLLFADSIDQCRTRGELHHAAAAGLVAWDAVAELGDVISGAPPGRTSDDQVTIADLTGVAVQDIAIAQAVLRALGHP